MLGDRQTGLGVVNICSGGSPVMPGHDFSAAGHFAVMPGKA